MGLYLPSGYLDFNWLLSRSLTWELITGGRGTGKSYGALTAAVDRGEKFIYLRRTQSQVDIISKPDFSPFKVINRDRPKDPEIIPYSLSKYTSGFYRTEVTDAGKLQPVGEPIGYAAALSTFSNVRGFDASDVTLIIYDEFIPEKHERPIKNEFDALANAYETVNRNRELNGQRPVRLLGLSNSNDISNAVFVGLDLVSRAVRMVKKQTEVYEDPRRGIGLYMPFSSPISKRKAETAIYQMTEGSGFAEMALDNSFVDDRTSTIIKSMPLKELTPLVRIGELCIYRVKGNDFYYASTHSAGTVPEYLMTSTDIMRFRRAYAWVSLAYLDRLIICEDYLAETLIKKVFDIT